MGSSVAYHLLAAEPTLKLAVVERDPTFTRASTVFSLGGVRVQFSLKENILISLYAQECFSRFEEEMAIKGEKPFINFRQEGYLFLIDPSGRAPAERSLDLQKKLGCAVEWWPPGKNQKGDPSSIGRWFCKGQSRPKGWIFRSLWIDDGIPEKGHFSGCPVYLR